MSQKDDFQPEDEEREEPILMEDIDLETLREAKKCQEHGESAIQKIKDPVSYQPYLDSLFKSLSKRESVLGRYNHVTAQSYKTIANVYSQMHEPRAVVMYRTCYRIQTFLYGQCHGPVSGKFKDILANRGLREDEINSLRKEVLKSMKHEMEGDLLRRLGDKKGALQEYQKAAKAEEFAFGRDNPDWAYLWRKMACLSALKKGMLDFDEADRMNHRWMRQANVSLSPSVCASIRRGDRYYDALLYSHAAGEYSKATTLEGAGLDTGSKRSKSSSSRNKEPTAGRQRTPHSSRKSTKPSMDLTKELQMLLSGDLTVNISDDNDEDDDNTPKRKGGEAPAANLLSRVGPKGTVTDISKALKKMKGTNTFFASLVESDSHSDQGTTDHRRPKAPEVCAISASVGKDYDQAFMSRVDGMIQKLQEERKRNKQQQENITAKEHAEYPPPKRPEADRAADDDSSIPSKNTSTSKNATASKCTSKHPKLVVSTSKISRKPPRSASSESSILRAMVSKYTNTTSGEPKKPKSESYLSKITDTTTKIASKTTKMAKKKLKKARQGLENSKPRSVSSIFGGSQHTRSRSFNIAQDEDGDNDDQQSKSKSTSYLVLGSPPMTPGQRYPTNTGLPPITPAYRVDDDGTNKSIESLPLLETEGDNAQEDYSIAHSEWLPPTSKNEKAKKFFSKGSSKLGQLLGSKKKDDKVRVLPVDEQSVMTSDESIKEHFLNETAQALVHSSSMRAGEQEPLSLVELVAHVQTMSGLLQRQTFRLQNKLSGRAMVSDKGIVSQSATAMPQAMPQDTKELAKEVERLFESCDDTLEQAFSRLDDSIDNPAFEDYRKTFTLEKTFLNELRNGVANVLADQSSVGSLYLEEDEEEEAASIKIKKSSESFDASLLDESRLSIVFEDTSNRSSSDWPKAQA